MSETTICKGIGCVAENASLFRLGKRCLIVTGKRSAIISGALRDVTSVLNAQGIAFTVYNGITENPLFDHCREAGKMGHDFGAEFVIGIGGGSPLDASKAAAVFACDPALTVDELFDPAIEKPSLPILAVPLTAGTGSEVNRYSVLTVENKKRSFSTEGSLPIAAFLDPTYLRTLSSEQTVSTAIDAFCHCLESYLSPKSTTASEADALQGGTLIWQALTENSFLPDDTDAAGLTLDTRMKMMEGAAYGGRAIKVTGTGFPHPLGYGLTLAYGIPHGKACGAFTAAYIACNMTTAVGRERLTRFSSHLGTTPEMIGTVIEAMADVNLTLSDAEINTMVESVSGAKNYQNAPYPLRDSEAAVIYYDLFGGNEAPKK